MTVGGQVGDPEARQLPRSSAYGAVLLRLAVFVAAILILFVRAPFAVSKFWAEDGSIFYQGGLDHGLLRGLTSSYAGYFHTIPRLAGWLASRFPVETAPLVEWIVLALVTGWAAVTSFSASNDWLDCLPSRLAISLGVVLLPVIRYESIGSIANLQMLLLFPALLVLISCPQRRIQWINGGLFLAITALTTPLVIVLAPLAALRYFYANGRQRKIDLFLTVWLMATGAHILFIVVTGPSRPTPASSVRGALSNIARRVILENFSPVTVGRKIWAIAFGMLIGLVLIVLVYRAIRVAWTADRIRAILLIAVPVTGALTWFGLTVPQGAPARYAIFPAMCLVWALLCAAETPASIAAAPHPWRQRSATLIAIGLVACWLPHIGADSYRRGGPFWREVVHQSSDECERNRDAVAILHIPPTTLDPNRWVVRVSCRLLLAGVKP
jgi:hypothetical protein